MRLRTIPLLAVAAGALACGGGKQAPEGRANRPNLVVYLIDTLRADHLGCYGHDRPVSPRIDAFARGAVLFREARAQSSWTKPAVATLLTGLYPIAHGAQRRSQGLDPSVVTLAERLREAGYETAYFGTNPTVTAAFGFARGFDEFRYLTAPLGPKSRRPHGRRRGSVGSDEIHRAVVEWLDRRERQQPARPFFLFVHTLDPHAPYRPSEPWRTRFAAGVDVEAACCLRAGELAALSHEETLKRAEETRALYDAEIAQNDAAFGALLDELDRRGLAEGSAVALTSDHGEEFYDHGGWGHASSLYEELLRVPFVLRLPGGARAGTVVEAPLDQVDVAPTLLDLAGLPVPAGLAGKSWRRALAGGEAPDEESLAWLEHPSFALASAKAGSWKWAGFGRTPPPGRAVEELFDLAADPKELRNRLEAEPERARRLRARLTAAAEAAPKGAGREVAIDAEHDRELRALGYL